VFSNSAFILLSPYTLDISMHKYTLNVNVYVSIYVADTRTQTYTGVKNYHLSSRYRFSKLVFCTIHQ